MKETSLDVAPIVLLETIGGPIQFFGTKMRIIIVTLFFV